MVMARTTTNFTLGFTSATLNSQTIEGSCVHQWIVQADAPMTISTNPVVPAATNALMGIPAITSSPVAASALNSFDGTIGWTATTTANISITQIGRWIVSGDNQMHTLYVYAGPRATPALLGSVVINAGGAAPGQYLYATLAMPISVPSGTIIAVMSSEVSGGDQWYDKESYIWTGDFSGTLCAYSAGDGFSINTGPALQAYIPVNIKYTVP
jgi:hypothetical protein